MFRTPRAAFLRSRTIPRLSPRAFGTTTASLSALFNLNGLAHSRESQFLSKERGLPRTEYSSNIQLIRSSEVDPFPNAPGASKHAIPAGSQASSPKRAGRQATTVSADPTNEAVLRHLDDGSYSAQSGKAVEELKAQLRALKAENAQLRASALKAWENRSDVKDHVSGSLPREILRFCLFLVGSYVLFSFFWSSGFQQHPLNEANDNTVADRKAVIPALQTELEEDGTKSISNSASALALENKPQDLRREHTSRNPLHFLWASA